MTDSKNIFLLKHGLEQIPEHIHQMIIKKHPNEFTLKSTNQNIRLVFIGKGGEGVVYKFGNMAIKFFYKSNQKFNKDLFVMSKISEINGFSGLVSDNFLKMYWHSQIGHSIDKTDPKDVLVTNLADGTLESWVASKHPEYSWYSMLFQILYSILIIQTQFVMCHNDLKPKNILFVKTPDTMSTFNVSSDDEYVECTIMTKYLFILSDFGHATSPYFPDRKTDMQCIQNNLDLQHIALFHRRLMVTIISEKMTFSELLEIGKSDKKFEEYHQKEKKQIWTDLHQYNEKTKQKMLFRSLAYYLIENGFFKDHNFESDKIYLPPKSIIPFLESLTETKGMNGIFDKLAFLANEILTIQPNLDCLIEKLQSVKSLNQTDKFVIKKNYKYSITNKK